MLKSQSMKLTIIAFLCLISQTIFGQNIFTKFVSQSSVQWAAHTVDTFHFSSPNLSLLLRKAFDRGAIKVGAADGLSNGMIALNSQKASILERIAPHRVMQVVDENGNPAGTTMEAENPLFSSNYFDSLVNDLVEIPQILFIQHGQLKTYVPWVSPRYTVTTSWGQRLGTANAFSTAFNTSRKICARQTKNALPLGRSSKLIQLDTAGQLSMLKQLYEQNLLEALWPSLHKKQTQIIRLDSLTIVPFEKMNTALLPNAVLSVPIYDEAGNVSSESNAPNVQPLDASSFSQLELVQDWYYHAKHNKLFSRISHLVLYADNFKNGRSEPILKIMLK